MAGIFLLTACGQSKQDSNSQEPTHSVPTTIQPRAEDLTSSHLRNRLQVELFAPVEKVWQLVGDPGRMPEYSAGLDSVVTKKDPKGACLEFTCYFKQVSAETSASPHRSAIKWYKPEQGWAAADHEPNAFGLSNSLGLVTVRPTSNGTLLTWSQYYNAHDLKANKESFAAALGDIGQQLISRFGGRLHENFVEGEAK